MQNWIILKNSKHLKRIKTLTYVYQCLTFLGILISPTIQCTIFGFWLKVVHHAYENTFGSEFLLVIYDLIRSSNVKKNCMNAKFFIKN